MHSRLYDSLITIKKPHSHRPHMRMPNDLAYICLTLDALHTSLAPPLYASKLLFSSIHIYPLILAPLASKRLCNTTHMYPIKSFDYSRTPLMFMHAFLTRYLQTTLPATGSRGVWRCSWLWHINIRAKYAPDLWPELVSRSELLRQLTKSVVYWKTYSSLIRLLSGMDKSGISLSVSWP